MQVIEPHVQTRVKVNAYVDRGIAPLVEALNELPEVMTCSSCEGRNGEDAWVAFMVGESTQQLANYVEKLSANLGKDDSLSGVSFRLAVEWYAGGHTPSAYLRVPRQHIECLAKSVRQASCS
jgi:hypothetical protein